MRFAARVVYALCAALAGLASIEAQPPQNLSRAVAVTIDDLPTVAAVRRDLEEAERITGELTGALNRHRVPAIGFVNEQKLRQGEAVDPARVALLQRWIDAGLELGNHTYSHPDLHRTPIEEFEREVLEGERVTRELLRRAGTVPRFFRHPFLRTGRDAATRTRLEAFLDRHGYRVAPVTIDNYDYTFAAAYDHVRAGGNATRVKEVVAAYLSYMEEVVGYYEQQSLAILGREIPHVLLLHANALNADNADALFGVFRTRGYRFVPLADALADAAYGHDDRYFGPAGITWLHRWAITRGLKGAIFAGEPAVPAWIERAARPRADLGKLSALSPTEEP